jgi:hypothetical protein
MGSAVSMSHFGLARLAMSRGDLAETESSLIEAGRLSEHAGNWGIGVAAALELAWLRHLQHDPVAIDTLLRNARRLSELTSSESLGGRVADMEARIAADGDDSTTFAGPAAKTSARSALSSHEEELLAIVGLACPIRRLPSAW